MTDIAKPEHQVDLAAQVFTFENLDIKMRIEKLNNEGDCELYVFYSNGQDDTLLRHTTAHLLSTSHLTTIVRQLKKNIDLDWDTMFTYITNMALTEYRKGEPVIALDENYSKTEPEYLLYPLFIKNAINTIYADRSSAKTLFVTLVDLILSLPWYDNPLDFQVGDTPNTILFLDWENNPEITGWTASRLSRGMGMSFRPIHYRHCSLPLADDIAQIKQKITEIKADTIIIDSIGMAVGDDLNLTKPAFRFFAGLRQLEPITSILIGHTAKNIETKRKTVYGNAYYENEARSIWEIVKDQQVGSPELNITLFHRKPPPFASVHEPLAYRFLFDGDSTMVELGNPKTDSRSKAEVSDIDVVEAIIAESNKPLQPRDIYNIAEHSINKNSIGVYCLTLKRSGKISRVNDGYIITKSL